MNYHRFIRPGVSDVPGRCFHFCTRRSNVPEPDIVDLGSNVKPPAAELERSQKIRDDMDAVFHPKYKLFLFLRPEIAFNYTPGFSRRFAV